MLYHYDRKNKKQSRSFRLVKKYKDMTSKGQLISKQNWRAVTSPKKLTKRTQDTILSAFRSVFWEKLRLDNFINATIKGQ